MSLQFTILTFLRLLPFGQPFRIVYYSDRLSTLGFFLCGEWRMRYLEYVDLVRERRFVFLRYKRGEL